MRDRTCPIGVRRGICGFGALLFSLLMIAFESRALDIASPSDLIADNTSLSLSVTKSEVLVSYRFFGEISPPPPEIVGTMAGQPLPQSNTTYFPSSTSKAAVLVMLDVSGRSREQQVTRDKLDALLFLNAAGVHRVAAIAVYSDRFELVTSRSGSPGEILSAEAFAPVRDSPSNLGAILPEAIKLIGAVEADRLRRDIVIFTDGHFDDVMDVAAIVSSAQRAGLSISFVLSDSTRDVNSIPLFLISSGTGGRILTAFQRENIQDILKYMNSGGLVRFPLNASHRFFWQNHPEVKISLIHGDKQFAVTAPAPLPIAGPIETARYLGATHPVIAGSSGLAVVALAAGGVFLLRRRRAATADESAPARPPETSERKTVYAVLQNIDDGSSHAISSAHVTLGRAADNDIVIGDKAVSREHAVIRRGDDGVFVVENRGSNGTTVNHLEVEQAELSDGDLITIGDTTLRFVRTKA